MPESEEVVVALGSNIRPEHHVPLAMALLEDRFRVLRHAPVYETPAIGRPDQAPYWNTASLLSTDIGPDELRGHLRAIETVLGRVRTADRWAARPIDLDVIWRGGTVVDPDVARRPFLRHLLEDLGKARHARTGRTLSSATAVQLPASAHRTVR